jgi:hypothetical protein
MRTVALSQRETRKEERVSGLGGNQQIIFKPHRFAYTEASCQRRGKTKICTVWIDVLKVNKPSEPSYCGGQSERNN